jgi:3-hydroxy-5-phosphonooxypentane-2,4-dione thiolase
MKNRLARIFNPKNGRTIMLAIDHGYFQGPTTGLERIDLDIMPLVPRADTLMLTRGILRSVIPPSVTKPIMIRASGGPSILKELSDEDIAMDMEDVLRIGACGTAIQVFIGGEFESRSVVNMTKLADAGYRYGVPTMAVTAVGKELERTPRYFRLATRMLAELGANIIKTYYTETEFETITAACPVPIVIAGGKKQPERDALEMAYRAIDQGAAGVDMGRNIFQSDSPQGMMSAIQAVVHENAKPKEAFGIYEQVKSEERKGR